MLVLLSSAADLENIALLAIREHKEFCSVEESRIYVQSALGWAMDAILEGETSGAVG